MSYIQVHEGFQGHLSGVKKDWKILAVNDVEKTENISLEDGDFAFVFKTLLKTGPKCKLTFMKSEVKIHFRKVKF